MMRESETLGRSTALETGLNDSVGDCAFFTFFRANGVH